MRESAVASGAVAFLTKPLRASELRDAVQRHARSARAQSALPERPRRAAAPPPSDALIATHEVDELKALGIHEDELDGMIVEFEQDGVELLKGALGAYQSRDLISLQNIMHSLKGAAGTVGAHVLAAKAFELEHAVWHDGSAEIQARITELEHLLKKSSNLLRGHVRHASVAGELH